MKQRYFVSWSKTYYANGEQIVEANSKAEAEGMVEENIGDLEGSLQWNPNQNIIEAFKLKETNE